MHHQNQIKRTLREAGDFVRQFLAERPEHSRNALAAELCQHFGFHDARGMAQQSTCLKALRELADEGSLLLPPPRIVRKGAPSPRRLAQPVPPPQGVPERVDLVKNLALRLVCSEEDFRRWNEVILREHPFGDRRLVGRQLRYLIESDHGCLGAVGFSSAALSLQDRDTWIGWSTAQRAQHLDQVICLSRLLIRPGLHCANLVSKVLGLLNDCFANDFQQRYHYRPWLLETFVEHEHHDGASLRAANWIEVGRSRGRGRQDRENQHNQSVKGIYMYVLDESFRENLGVPEFQRYSPQGVEEGLGVEQWAHHEFAEAKMGDARLSRRLVSIAGAKGAAPGLPFSEAVNGQAAALAGYYRFMDQPDESQVGMDEILEPHRHRTLCRMQAQREILCIHDTTDLMRTKVFRWACSTGIAMPRRSKPPTKRRGTAAGSPWRRKPPIGGSTISKDAGRKPGNSMTPTSPMSWTGKAIFLICSTSGGKPGRMICSSARKTTAPFRKKTPRQKCLTRYRNWRQWAKWR
jgi:hypothetical protein